MAITSTGFEFEILPGALDDMELLDDLCLMDDGGTEGAKATKRVLISLIGEEGRKALYEHCRGENKRVKASDVVRELGEIFKAVNEDKKK